MKLKIRQTYLRLGTPDAISWINIVVLFILQMAGSTITSLSDFAGRELEFYLLRILALLSVVPAFLLGRLALNKFAVIKPRPLITLVTFATGVLLTTIVFDTLLVAAGFAEEHQILRRLSVTTVGLMTIFIVTSLFVTYSKEFSRKNADLRAAANELVLTREEAKLRIDERKTDLIESIRREIDQQLQKISGENSQQNVTHMRSLIDDVVRPISYALAKDVLPEEKSLTQDMGATIDWKTVTTNALHANPFHYVSAPLMLGAIGASFLISTFQGAGVIAALAMMAMTALLTVIGKALWPLVPIMWGTVSRSVLYSAFNTIIALVTAPIMTGFTGFMFTAPQNLGAWVIIVNLSLWTVTLVSTVNLNLRQTNAQLRETLEELKREVISLNNAYRQLQKGISRVLHGPIQQAITSALIKMQQAPSKNMEKNLATDLRTKITSSLDLLSEPISARSDVNTTLEELTAFWSEAVNIHYNISTRDIEILNAHHHTALSAEELIQEACSNAIKHGDAKNIDIDIKVHTDTDTVELTINNDGLQLNKVTKPGLGSQLFDEMTLTWSRVQQGNRVFVTAQIPLSEPNSNLMNVR